MPPPLRHGTYLNTITKPGGVLQYLRVCAGPQRDRYVHQLVAEAKLGRALLPNEEVDHDNGNTLDNHWENLIVRTISAHAVRTNAQRAVNRRARQQRRQARRRVED